MLSRLILNQQLLRAASRSVIANKPTVRSVQSVAATAAESAPNMAPRVCRGPYKRRYRPGMALLAMGGAGYIGYSLGASKEPERLVSSGDPQVTTEEPQK